MKSTYVSVLLINKIAKKIKRTVNDYYVRHVILFEFRKKVDLTEDTRNICSQCLQNKTMVY